MAIIRSSYSDKLSINNQHDYFTLRMPKGTLTLGHYAYKATRLTNEDFMAILDYLDPDRTGHGKEVFDRMHQLLNPRNLKKLVKDWDVSPSKPSKADLPKFKKGQTVSVDFKALEKTNPSSATRLKTKYAVRGKVTGEVIQVTSVNVVVQVTKGGVTTNVKMPRTWVK
jgi:hypothetical protein